MIILGNAIGELGRLLMYEASREWLVRLKRFTSLLLIVS